MCVTKRTSKENWLMTVVAQILDRMSGIAKPQRKFLLTLFATMLITRGRHNFLSLSRHSSLDEKTYRRQFQKEFSFLCFNQLSIDRIVPTQNTKLFAQDTTFSRKCGKQTYGLDHFWNGTTSRAEKGLEVSLISIVDVEANQGFALSAEQTPPQPEKKRREETSTRIDFYLAQLQRTAPYFPATVEYGVVDGFYAKEKFVSGVCALNYHLISRLRADARLLYLYEGAQKKRGRRRKYDGRVTFNDLSRFEKIEASPAHITLYTLVVWSVSLRRRVRVVIVVNNKEPDKPRYAVLFSTDTQLAATDIFHFYLAQLQRTAPYFPATVEYGVVDGFYAKEKFVSGVCALNYHLISRLRADARLLYLYEGAQKKRGRRRKYDGRVTFNDLSRFEKIEASPAHITLYTLVVWSVSLRRRVRVVIVVNNKEPDKPRYAVLFSTDTQLAATDIFRFYKARFQIEFIFRDAKQFAGFSDCQARDKEALHFHFNTSVATVNLARIMAQEEEKAEEKFVFSMASIKQRAFNEHLLNLIISKLALDQSAVKNHPQFEYLRNYAAIAA
jgi:hypothetical protein